MSTNQTNDRGSKGTTTDSKKPQDSMNKGTKTSTSTKKTPTASGAKPQANKTKK